jgi:phage shock protein C
MSKSKKRKLSKRLFRSKKDRIIAGISGGLADYFNTDPSIIRLILVILLFLSFGSILLFYIIAWIIIPLEKK